MPTDGPLVLFTGSRDWPNFDRVYSIMDDLIDVLGQYRVVQGGARGVDTFVDVCAKIFHLDSHTERPRYDLYPSWQAPKLRNTAMLMMKPVAVVAFWWEHSTTGGTLDCIEKAVNVFRIPVVIYRS